MKNRLIAISMVSGLTLLTVTVGSLIVPSLLFMLGISITALHIWPVVALSVGMAWMAAKMLQVERPGRLLGEALAVSILLFVVCFWISGSFYDLSYDGQAYHQESVIYLANGWNPVYDEALNVSTGHSLWINHYGRASEIASAVMYAATGLIEHSKVFNLLMIVASFLLSMSALLALRPDQTKRAIIVAALLALNPVSVYQVFSYYVDGLLASVLLCLVALACLIFARPGWLLLSAYSALMIFAMNIKFTGIAYAGVLTLGLLVALYMSEQFGRLKQMFMIAAVGGLIGMFLIGYNPYVTNTLAKGNPFYPLAGAGAVDVIEDFIPRNLESMNRFEQAVNSNFSVMAGNTSEKTPTQIKLPFTFTERELIALSAPDAAVSGFGPLFSGVLLLSLILLALGFHYRKGAAMAAIGLIVILAISAFVNPVAWWARYVPQFWIIPLICVWLGFSIKGNRVVTGASWLLIAVISINTVIVGSTYTYYQYTWNQTLREQLSEIQSAQLPVKADFTYSWSNRERLTKLGIAFVEERPLKCEDKLTLTHSGTSICMHP
ncbi:hypothetical protein OB236_35155 [Paenibacillus sp. WQ 127069]|uniref:Glycosyltransferase RgtA/B/C/D-like domain-containing protein n=1 Tax=Paenibacillus baimaensis TaxID=2982185 RepID=A0ABT2URV3_9BACL|nr:hypothetical protein [Paenibacillus sp. WQ 127069]MCU6797380.1 hypothetical protein [Paenibacillus sp. WQ 127069]